jgi:hypothetical protein
MAVSNGKQTLIFKPSATDLSFTQARRRKASGFFFVYKMADQPTCKSLIW